MTAARAGRRRVARASAVGIGLAALLLGGILISSLVGQLPVSPANTLPSLSAPMPSGRVPCV